MSFIEHKIIRWDSVTYGNYLTPRPMLYLVPTLDFMDLVQRNNYIVRVDIRGTGVYDGEHLGTVYSSSNMPSCRPNFFAVTGEYVIVLEHTSWLGYPRVGNGSFRMKDRYPSLHDSLIPEITDYEKASAALAERELSAISKEGVIQDIINKIMSSIDKESDDSSEVPDLLAAPELLKSARVPTSNRPNAGSNDSGGLDSTTRTVLYVAGGVILLAVIIALGYALLSHSKS